MAKIADDRKRFIILAFTILPPNQAPRTLFQAWKARFTEMNLRIFASW